MARQNHDRNGANRRVLRPRATDAIAVTPVTGTDRTSATVFGLEERPFREIVRALRIPHVMHGRRMIVLVADFIAAIERAKSTDTISTADAEELEEDDVPSTVDALLARIGRRRTA